MLLLYVVCTVKFEDGSMQPYYTGCVRLLCPVEGVVRVGARCERKVYGRHQRTARRHDAAGSCVGPQQTQASQGKAHRPSGYEENIFINKNMTTIYTTSMDVQSENYRNAQ